MRDFLIKIKFIDFLTIKLKTQKNDFVKLLKANIDDDNKGVFTEIFSSSNNYFKGKVDYDGFKLKKKRSFFERNNIVVAKGKFTQQNDDLIIDIEINGFHNMMMVFFIFILIFYGIFITSFFLIGNNIEFDIFGIIYFFFHASLMIGIPFFVIKYGVSKMKRELEREFVFINQKKI